MTEIPPIQCKSLTPELRTSLVERTNLLLLRIVRANLYTQYASETTSLASFRDATSTHGIDTDTVLVEDFRAYVPLSDYESYRPFMEKFNKRPCKETEVMNLFAPGLPNFLAISSGTSGREPKLFPIYPFRLQGASLYNQGLGAVLYNYGYRDIKEVEREPDLIVKRIPVCPSSAGILRELERWAVDDDDKRMSLILPGHVAPWAVSMIKHHRSSLMIHALFSLACRDLDRIFATFLSVFFDLIRHVDDVWEMVVSSIGDGTIPTLEGVGEVRSHLQAHFHANPERAAELREIGPPLSSAGWAARVWPKLRLLTAICNGPFATVLPNVKSIIGPTVTIRSHGIVTSESSVIAAPYMDSLDVFVLRCNNILEFLDVVAQESHETLCQVWDLDVGREYEVVLTTNDGLWRYRLGDIIAVVGFAIDDGSPIFTYSGRRNLAIRLDPVLISDTQLAAAVKAIGSDVIRVHEFTTMVDVRQTPPTVGFFIEPSGEIGPKSYLAAQNLSDGLVATNMQYQKVRKEGWIRLPTVRILKPGTFTEYRQWIGFNMNVGQGQTKVPVVMVNSTSQEWILQRVIREL